MRSAKQFWKDRRGNFGILTTLMLVPMIGAAGMAVDYSYENDVHTELMQIADAAALGAISQQSPGYAQIQQMQTDGEVTIAEDDGKKLFLAQRSNGLSQGLNQLPLDVSITVAKSGGQVKSTVVFSTQVPTTFMKIFGQDTIPVSGTATAVYGDEVTIGYTDFYMLLDNSPSMGIGATQADMNALMAATANAPDAAGRNCAFACHMAWTDKDGNITDDDENSDYYIAKSANATLRIDVVTKAVKSLTDDLKPMQSTPDLIRIAAYTLGKAAPQVESASSYNIYKQVALTGDLTTVGNAAGQITLMTTPHHNYDEDALTSFDTALTDIGKEIKADGGKGTSTSDRQEIVFFVTDGMGDSRKSGACGGSTWADPDRCLEPINVSYCAALKKRNIKVAVLYTTYLPIPTDAIWNTAINPVFASQIGPKLKECASDGLFLEVSPTKNMDDALKALFVKAASSTNLRLSS